MQSTEEARPRAGPPSVLFPVEPLVHGGLGGAGGRETRPILWMARHAKEVLIREAVPRRLDQGAPILPGWSAPETLEGHKAGFARPFVVRCHTLTLRLWEKFSTVLAQETSSGVIHLDEAVRSGPYSQVWDGTRGGTGRSPPAGGRT